MTRYEDYLAEVAKLRTCTRCKIQQPWEISMRWVGYWKKGTYHDAHLCPACAYAQVLEEPKISELLGEAGFGDQTDEAPDCFNVAAIRLSSHGPAPEEADDIPGWALAGRLELLLHPTLDDTLEGVAGEALCSTRSWFRAEKWRRSRPGELTKLTEP